MEQSQDTASGLQRSSDPWRTLCEGLAAPPGESPGLLCPFHLHIPGNRDVFPASPGVEFSWKCRIALWTLQLMERSDERFDTSMAATKQGVWTTLTWGLLVFAALLPIGLLSWYAWHLTSHAVRHLVAANNLSAATMTAEWLSRDLEHSVNLARAFAALPDMLEAVEL